MHGTHSIFSRHACQSGLYFELAQDQLPVARTCNYFSTLSGGLCKVVAVQDTIQRPPLSQCPVVVIPCTLCALYITCVLLKCFLNCGGGGHRNKNRFTAKSPKLRRSGGPVTIVLEWRLTQQWTALLGGCEAWELPTRVCTHCTLQSEYRMIDGRKHMGYSYHIQVLL